MYQFNVCAVCLNTGVALYNMDECRLRVDFNVVTDLIKYPGESLPNCLCLACVAKLKKYKRFRNKCQRANMILKAILRFNPEILLPDMSAVSNAEENRALLARRIFRERLNSMFYLNVRL